MTDVRKLTDDQLEPFARIAANAYPGAKHNTPDGFERLKEHVKKSHGQDWSNFYGCFRDDRLVGGMLELDYTMNLHRQMVPIGGVAFAHGAPGVPDRQQANHNNCLLRGDIGGNYNQAHE